MSVTFDVSDLQKKLASISSKVANQYIQTAVAQGAKTVQAAAKLNAPVNDGELRRSIKTKVETTTTGARGIIYTNAKHAPYVEFGTGPKGQASYVDTAGVNPTYTQTAWWIHESQLDASTVSQYNWFYVDTAQGRFYKCTGQEAQPYLYPALANSQDAVNKQISDYLSTKLKEEALK